MKVDQETLAEIMGVSPRTIRSWQADGMPAEGDRRRRKYDTRACIEWAAANRIDGAAATGEDEDLPTIEESDRRWKRARARLKEVEARERRGELIEFREMLDLVEDVMTRVRARLLNLPGRRLAEIAAETDRAEVREIRMQGVREILEELQEMARAARREEREKIERLDEEER